MSIQDLANEVAELHYPSLCAVEDDFRSFRNRTGYSLPADMEEFYKTCNGAKLFDRNDPPYTLVSIERIVKANEAILDSEADMLGPDSWFVFCDVRDGNYISIDLARSNDSQFHIFDCFHETFPDPDYTTVIARSFAEFLERALRSNGYLFWL